jgi:protein subunit release factor A
MSDKSDDSLESEFTIEALPDPTKVRGGQNCGPTINPIRVTHLPTGIYAVCDAGYSQHRNKRIALAMVEYGLAEMGYSRKEKV